MAYNVTTDFGANNLVGDGATDNAAAFNAALAALPKTGGVTDPATLYFPAGTYIFTTQPSAIPTAFTIYGDGMNQTLIKGTRASRVTDAVWSLASNADITLRDMQFTTTDTANAVETGLLMVSALRIVLERLKFTNCYAEGVRSSGASQVLASQCEFTHIYQHADASMLDGAYHSSSFVGCSFYANGGTTTTSHCVYLNGPAGTIPANVSFVGCVFQSWTGGQAIEVDGDETSLSAQAITVDSCQFFYGPSSGWAIVFNDVQTATVNNCQLYCPSAPGMSGIEIFSCDSWSVTNCTFNNSSTVFGGAMILVGIGGDQKYGNYGLIRGNQFFAGTSTYSQVGAVGLLDAGHVLIEGNMFVGIGLPISTGAVGNTSNVSNLVIQNNQFVIAPAATRRTIGGSFYGSANDTYALAFDGAASNIRFVDNIVSGFTYEVYFTQFSYAGNVSGFAYRCGNFGSQGTFGFTGGAVPTGMVRWAAAQIPMTPSTVTAANITTVNE